jgi:hypothetical protein
LIYIAVRGHKVTQDLTLHELAEGGFGVIYFVGSVLLLVFNNNNNNNNNKAVMLKGAVTLNTCHIFRKFLAQQ